MMKGIECGLKFDVRTNINSLVDYTGIAPEQKAA